ncbi:MAG: bifunctional diaminohydroxyphosphoribosylaminopyrimidine deaminase/5-amino-6-(5-phosphoribosylamino)uracil reductase RibD [Chloroflexi bacterium]|nr:bifunctional diaminohydroxyphosphoribosylaminopyrimidine deaminase/5-amino-6-(5-phosphoribosylamino)uracil reductase RibD [Chloroflexota bacterium]
MSAQESDRVLRGSDRVNERAHEPADQQRLKRPFVTVKIAQTLDGRIATRTGQSQWITCEASRALAHELRATHDAVLVGVGTVVADNPRLTVRLVQGPNPLRVVVDTRLRIPSACTLLTDGAETTVCVASETASAERIAAVRARGARVLLAADDPKGGLDLADVLSRLASGGVRSVMVEGGAGIITSLLRGRLVDRLVICIAPKILGAGLDAVGDLGITSLTDALTFSETAIRQLGADIVFDGRVVRPASHPDVQASQLAPCE